MVKWKRSVDKTQRTKFATLIGLKRRTLQKKTIELIRKIYTAQWKNVHTGYRTTYRYTYYGMMTVIQQNLTAYSKKASKHIWFLIKFYSFSTEDMIKFVTIARVPRRLHSKNQDKMHNHKNTKLNINSICIIFSPQNEWFGPKSKIRLNTQINRSWFRLA